MTRDIQDEGKHSSNDSEIYCPQWSLHQGIKQELSMDPKIQNAGIMRNKKSNNMPYDEKF